MVKPAAASSNVAESGPPTFESLGRQLRELLPNRRLHSVSFCDSQANCLWLSEGALGPDEHAMVSEALELLTADAARATHELTFEDGRFALFLAVRNSSAALVGIAMVLADGKAPGGETLERLSAAPMLSRLAALMRPSDSQAPAAAAPPAAHAQSAPHAQEATPEQIDRVLEFELSVDELPAPARPAPKAAQAASPSAVQAAPAAAPANAPPPTPARVAQVFPPPAPAPVAAVVTAPQVIPEAAREEPAAQPQESPSVSRPPTPTATVASIGMVVAGSDANLLLEVLPFGKLRAGGQMRRFQVLPRVSPGKRDPAALDALVLQRLMAWLAAHRAAWSHQPTGFTLNLSVASLEDDRFVHKVTAALNAHGISPETLGFELTEALCSQRRAQMERFLAQCEKAGAWVVVDDFSFDSQVLPLVRSKAVRMVKMDPRLTSSALKDKLSQAMVVATIQAAKVLGIHCAAKKVDSQAALQWLTAIGCDFAQGSALAASQTLDSLAPPAAS